MPSLTRRHVLACAALGALGGAGAYAAHWFNVTARNDGDGLLSPPQAHRAAEAGAILLVDIRRPDEWARTGVGEGAQPLDMRRPDFAQALVHLAGGETGAPIALICARGVRSRHLSAALTNAGFTNIIDIPEGMLGSGAGPGWMARGLPVIAWQG
ncbi:MAG: rhodanese-like domain-containing protein [Pseudomonadota bacterium]